MASWNEPKNGHYNCPYWSRLDRSCQLIYGGLFIPVNDHVDAYCQSSNYLSCPHLINAREVDQFPEKNDEASNRRRYERTPSRHIIKVAEYKSQELAEIPLEDSACTVDISPAGIRLESFNHFEQGTLVSLYLDQSFAGIGIRSVGKVKWCKSLINTPFYHAGIDLEDKILSNNILKNSNSKTIHEDTGLLIK